MDWRALARMVSNMGAGHAQMHITLSCILTTAAVFDNLVKTSSFWFSVKRNLHLAMSPYILPNGPMDTNVVSEGQILEVYN